MFKIELTQVCILSTGTTIHDVQAITFGVILDSSLSLISHVQSPASTISWTFTHFAIVP